MKFQHQTLAAGRWQELSLAEQLGNMGSEIGRAIRWQEKDPAEYEGALRRARELLDLTIQDPRWKGRLKELTRLRELFSDAVLGGVEYGTRLEDLDSYLFPFAFAARKRHSEALSSGFSTLGILAIIAAVLVVAGGGYFAYQRFVMERVAAPTVNSFEDCVKAGYPVGESYPRQCWTPDGRRFVEETKPETPAIDTSNWKTYRNEQYGFEVRYPSDLKVGEGNLNIYKEFSTQGHGAGFSSDFSSDANTEFEIYVLSGYEISNFNSGTNSTIFMNRHRLESKSQDGAAMSISGIPASEVDVSLSGLERTKPYIKNLYFSKGDVIYVFADRTNFEGWTLEQSQRRIDRFYQILSTFKFIK
mgnify:FL=1